LKPLHFDALSSLRRRVKAEWARSFSETGIRAGLLIKESKPEITYFCEQKEAKFLNLARCRWKRPASDLKKFFAPLFSKKAASSF
jgi:hypothetical protein